MIFTRTIIAAALIAVGAAFSLAAPAQAGGWTNTGGLAWFK